MPRSGTNKMFDALAFPPIGCLRGPRALVRMSALQSSMHPAATPMRGASGDEFFDAFGQGDFRTHPTSGCAHNAKPAASYCVIVADRRREAWARTRERNRAIRP